jgi:hypothetical protein
MKRGFKKLFDEERKECKKLQEALRGKKRWNVRYAYMDGVDFQHELSGCETTAYASPTSLLQHQPCADECGIFRVKVTLDHEVVKQEFNPKNCFSGDDAEKKTKKYKKFKRQMLRHTEENLARLVKKIEWTKNYILRLKQELEEDGD